MLSDKKLHKNKIAIVGNPNVGKSSIFNHLTTSYSLVANFPYTTVSTYRSEIAIDNERYEIIDTPGIISLNAQSEDGLVTRNIIMQEHPEVIVMCMDTNNLKRSLVLLSQFMEFAIPIVVCLNFLDESRQKGISISTKKLEEALGLPVVETVATEGRGIKELVKAIKKAAVPEKTMPEYKKFIEDSLNRISDCFPHENMPSDAALFLLLSKDPFIEEFIRERYGAQILHKVQEIISALHCWTSKDISHVIFEARDKWAQEIYSEAATVSLKKQNKYGEKFAHLSRHPVCGWIILAFIVYITFIAVGKLAAGIITPFVEDEIFGPVNDYIASFVPWPLLDDFLFGNYGILTIGIENAVATVLPILTIFFLILNILEDSGYLPNMSVLCNRLFQKIGLSGKAILPVVLGFGCKTMATLTTKILDSKKERYIAIFLIAFAIPCSSQLGVNIAVLAMYPIRAFIIVFLSLIFIELVAGVILNRIIKQDSRFEDFIMEIPPMRLPDVKSLIIKTYYRLKWFLVEALPLFIAGAALLFLMDKLYLLDLTKEFVFPVIVVWLNLPIEIVDALLLCIVRHEAGAVLLLDLVRQGKLDEIQTMVSIIMITCFVPCFANIMAMIKQLGFKSALAMTLVIIFFSVIIGLIANSLLRFFFGA